MARIVASGASKKSRRSAQGGSLPPDKSPLGAYPVGCCVMIEPGDVGGGASWHMILYRIGGEGAPHCARMSVPPDQNGWNGGLREAREIRADTVVLGSRWPYRPTSREDGVGERDPLADDDVVEGALMLGHLSSDR